MSSIFKEEFEDKACPFCYEKVSPKTKGKEPHRNHGWQLICPVCERHIGWGGKLKNKSVRKRSKPHESIQAEFCSVCLRTKDQVDLERHRINPDADYTMDNVLVVCQPCHQLIHTIRRMVWT